MFALFIQLSSCSEHSGHTISDFTGDYRFTSGIGEFFNCSDHKRYFVAKSGIHKELSNKYLALNMKDNDDVFLRVKGYLKQEKLMDGIDPVTIFVPVEFIAFDKSRGCEPAIRKGH